MQLRSEVPRRAWRRATCKIPAQQWRGEQAGLSPCCARIQLMRSTTIDDILHGHAPQDKPVTVKGWVRTRRDSKAGLSFLHVSDGSCFDPLQVVAPAALPNYASEIMRLTAGCAVEAIGPIVPSQGKGQPFEMQASAVKVVGWVDDPDTYPIQPKRAHDGVPARGRAPAPAHERDRRRHARAPHARAGDPPLLPRARLLLGPHADHHGVRRRGRRRRCSASRRSTSRTCRARRTARSTSRRTSSARETLPDRVRAAQRRDVLPGAVARSTRSARRSAPRTRTRSRHLAEFWMIEPEIAFADLADDATLAEDFLKYIFTTRARRARRRHGVLRGARRQGR